MPVWLLILLLSLTLVGPALGSDGVLEINQVCATQTGCFAGDTAGFPVTISQSGSYRLTSSLSQGFFPPFGTPVDAIQINTSNVQIDLGGFSINCVSVFAGEDCPASLTAAGIIALADPQASGVRIANGIVHGMPSVGVFLRDRSVVENVQASQNGNVGIRVGSASRVSRCIASDNSSEGILTFDGSIVSHNNVNNNRGSNGIWTGGESIVTDNVVTGNGSLGAGVGIRIGPGSTVSGNVVSRNVQSGIVAISDGSTVSGNTVIENGNYGLNLAFGVVYRDNNIRDNETGGVYELPVNLGGNYCFGPGVTSSTCP